MRRRNLQRRWRVRGRMPDVGARLLHRVLRVLRPAGGMRRHRVRLGLLSRPGQRWLPGLLCGVRAYLRQLLGDGALAASATHRVAFAAVAILLTIATRCSAMP